MGPTEEKHQKQDGPKVIRLDSQLENKFQAFGLLYALTNPDAKQAFEDGKKMLDEVLAAACCKTGLFAGYNPDDMKKNVLPETPEQIDPYTYRQVASDLWLRQGLWEHELEAGPKRSERKKLRERILRLTHEEVSEQYFERVLTEEQRNQLAEAFRNHAVLSELPSESEIARLSSDDLPCEKALRAFLSKLPGEPVEDEVELWPIDVSDLTPKFENLRPPRSIEQIVNEAVESVLKMTPEEVEDMMSPGPFMEILSLEEYEKRLREKHPHRFEPEREGRIIPPLKRWRPPQKLDLSPIFGDDEMDEAASSQGRKEEVSNRVSLEGGKMERIVEKRLSMDPVLIKNTPKEGELWITSAFSDRAASAVERERRDTAADYTNCLKGIVNRLMDGQVLQPSVAQGYLSLIDKVVSGENCLGNSVVNKSAICELIDSTIRQRAAIYAKGESLSTNQRHREQAGDFLALMKDCGCLPSGTEQMLRGAIGAGPGVDQSVIEAALYDLSNCLKEEARINGGKTVALDPNEPYGGPVLKKLLEKNFRFEQRGEDLVVTYEASGNKTKGLGATFVLKGMDARVLEERAENDSQRETAAYLYDLAKAFHSDAYKGEVVNRDWFRQLCHRGELQELKNCSMVGGTLVAKNTSSAIRLQNVDIGNASFDGKLQLKDVRLHGNITFTNGMKSDLDGVVIDQGTVLKGDLSESRISCTSRVKQRSGKTWVDATGLVLHGVKIEEGEGGESAAARFKGLGFRFGNVDKEFLDALKHYKVLSEKEVEGFQMSSNKDFGVKEISDACEKLGLKVETGLKLLPGSELPHEMKEKETCVLQVVGIAGTGAITMIIPQSPTGMARLWKSEKHYPVNVYAQKADAAPITKNVAPICECPTISHAFLEILDAVRDSGEPFAKKSEISRLGKAKEVQEKIRKRRAPAKTKQASWVEPEQEVASQKQIPEEDDLCVVGE